jgi:hypothetical protein
VAGGIGAEELDGDGIRLSLEGVVDRADLQARLDGHSEAHVGEVEGDAWRGCA